MLVKGLCMFESVLLIPSDVTVFFFFVCGSFFGSFANVLIYRMQREGENLNLFKGSCCLSCSYKIPFYLNIPILSWFFLRGKCKNCKSPFSFRYPLVELLMSFLFSALFLLIGWKWFLLEALLFVFILVVASFIDWDQMILPDSLTLSGIIIGLLGSWLNPERFFLDSLLGLIVGGGFLLLISSFYYFLRGKEGMGGGDIKMMAWIGAVLGWQSLTFILLSSCFLGSLAGFGIMLHSRKNTLQKAFPFGPYLAISSLIYIFLSYRFEDCLSFFMPLSSF